MRIVRCLACLLGGWLAASVLAPAQSLDVFAGLNALTASQAVSSIPRLGGGLFPSAGVSLYLGPVGIGAEAAFRAAKSSASIRPIYYDVNFLVEPIHVSRSIIPELMLGLGAQTVRDYQNLGSCGALSNCVNYAGTHFAGHVGVGLKVFVNEHIFLRPEAHFYFIRNNQAFQTSNSERFGVSLGYTFGGG